ncbi:MAG: ATP-binding protein [Deltaproteobacteria bacterium]|jgi:hypothetical protein|nr:ATP-binding protein [Deltaproteobacteria bacterium]
MTAEPPRRFNTTGVCNPLEHYMIPAVPRIPDVNDMIDGKYYFVIHAPRQSGKTTCLAALTDKINSDGHYYSICCDLAALRNIRDDEKAMRRVVNQINAALESSEVDELSKLAYAFNSSTYMADADSRVRFMLRDICRALDRELVVFFDEADCLLEDPLITFLSQIRTGYLHRRRFPRARFPRSMALVGMRDIRDYLTKVRPDGESQGPASPFNVKKKSLSLADFTREEIGALYGQHTSETGQVFEPEAVERSWHWTEGQPWLVNALAYDIIEERFRNDHSRAVTGSDIDLAARDIILRNDTHFRSLRERLREPRVRRVVEAVLVGADSLTEAISNDDAQYAIDLGLLKADPDTGEPKSPANLIYKEIIVRTLTENLQTGMPKDLPGKWMDGTRLDMNGLLEAFQDYWRKNRKSLAAKNVLESRVFESVAVALKRFNITNDTGMAGMPELAEMTANVAGTVTAILTDRCNEAFCLLVLFAFLQRVVNGGAKIDREYALGRTRVDIFVQYKGIPYPLELKIKGVQSREESLRQLYGYMEESGASTGWLVVFDKDMEKPWDEKVFWDTLDYGGKTIHVVGC